MSNLEACPTCGNATSINAEACPSCGEPLGKNWASGIRKKKRLEIDQAERDEKKAKLAQKRKSRKHRLIGAAIIIGPIAWYFGSSWYDNYETRNLKSNNPIEFQKRISALEEQVAKVPATKFNKNIELYNALLELDPKNKRYADKIAHYEKKKKEAKAAKKAAETAKELAKKAEERRKGFHCLSGWDGSHRAVKEYAEKRMRDPDSFEHISTYVTPVNANGEHKLTMTYRAKNGFGGISTGVVTATLQNAGCAATITSME